MKYRKLLKDMKYFGLIRYKITSRDISMIFGISLDHANHDLARLHSMRFMSRKRHSKDKRKFVYWMNKKGRKYLDYLDNPHDSEKFYKIQFMMEAWDIGKRFGHFDTFTHFEHFSPEVKLWLRYEIIKMTFLADI